jgi:apolipoprotein D and lipocalin family protein
MALALAATMTGCASVPADGAAPQAPVRAVAQVDLQRYAGRWYEIAAYPMVFQRQCVGDTTAEYALRPDGRIGVLNRCRTASGHSHAQAVAWPVEGSGNAKLKVSFFWPFRADYWVIGLADDYRWAVVGDPGRRYLWVLARTPEMAPADLERAREAARMQGYDLAPLRATRHGG